MSDEILRLYADTAEDIADAMAYADLADAMDAAPRDYVAGWVVILDEI